VDLAVLPADTWDAVEEHDLEVAVLEAAETGGIDAARRAGPVRVDVLAPNAARDPGGGEPLARCPASGRERGAL
jgi:hypothetical protein